jgi:DNA-binding NarL/FixJ family response regulator
MKPATLPLRDQGEPNRGSEDRQGRAVKRVKPRSRALLLACDSEDAQLMMMMCSDRMEITYLPSYEMKEVREEIERCKPKFIVCGAGAFLEVLASQQLANPSRPRKDASRVSADKANHPIARREMKVLAMLAKGQTNGDIAKALFLSPRTVKRVLSSLFERLRVTNRTELASRVAELSLLEDEVSAE